MKAIRALPALTGEVLRVSGVFSTSSDGTGRGSSNFPLQLGLTLEIMRDIVFLSLMKCFNILVERLS